MSNVWLKVKVWSKIVFAGLLFLYVLAFLLKNTGQQPVKLWFWFGTELSISPLLLVFVTFLLGVIAAILFRTTFQTVKQFQEMRRRARAQRTERELAEMKSKAGRLHTRSESPPPSPPPPSGAA